MEHLQFWKQRDSQEGRKLNTAMKVRCKVGWVTNLTLSHVLVTLYASTLTLAAHADQQVNFGQQR